MKSTLRWTWPLLLLAVALLTPWAVFRLRPERALDVLVVDKTVPFTPRIEHRSLFWLLAQYRVVRPDGLPYEARRDYVGAFPGPRPGDPPARTVSLTAQAARAADLLYVADTYGIYRDDLASGTAMRAALERSPKIYGGLEVDEARAIRAALDDGGLVVAEFNSMGSPTGAEARTIAEETFGVRWTRWSGRFFGRLESREDVPQWMRDQCSADAGRPWDHAGPGYVVVNEDGACVVLLVGRDVDAIGLTLERRRPVDPLLRDADDDVAYPYWFEWVEPAPGATTLADYHWRLREAGRERLGRRGLPEVFAAVVRRRPDGAGEDHGGGTAYYLAGDFADNPMPDRRIPLAGYLALRRALEGVRVAPGESAFFFRFYAPLVGGLLDEAAGRTGHR